MHAWNGSYDHKCANAPEGELTLSSKFALDGLVAFPMDWRLTTMAWWFSQWTGGLLNGLVAHQGQLQPQLQPATTAAAVTATANTQRGGFSRHVGRWRWLVHCWRCEPLAWLSLVLWAMYVVLRMDLPHVPLHWLDMPSTLKLWF
jgi:hypothetical protein